MKLLLARLNLKVARFTNAWVQSCHTAKSAIIQPVNAPGIGCKSGPAIIGYSGFCTILAQPIPGGCPPPPPPLSWENINDAAILMSLILIAERPNKARFACVCSAG